MVSELIGQAINELGKAALNKSVGDFAKNLEKIRTGSFESVSVKDIVPKLDFSSQIEALRSTEIPAAFDSEIAKTKLDNTGTLESATELGNRSETAVEKYDSARELTDSEREKFAQNNPQLGSEALNSVRVTEEGEFVIKTTNMKLEGKSVYDANDNVVGQYVQKEVTLPSGDKVSGVFLDFNDSKFEATMPSEKTQAANDVQFREATSQLREAIKENQELGKQFTSEQLEAIEHGDSKIPGLTWHHDTETGKLVLVDSEVHENNRHTGGDSLWGRPDRI